MSRVVISIPVAIVIIISWYFWQPSNKEMLIDQVQQEIQTVKSLDFDSSSELMKLLTAYADELHQMHYDWHIAWFGDQQVSQEKLAELIAINKVMLKSYMGDLQDYMKCAPSHALVQFTYDKVVRLTIALAELEKNNDLLLSEYKKKVDRMCQITHQALAHSKKTLRAYLHGGIDDHDAKVNYERQYLTSKMSHFIALERMLYH
jgi:hypothetical protein